MSNTIASTIGQLIAAIGVVEKDNAVKPGGVFARQLISALEKEGQVSIIIDGDLHNFQPSDVTVTGVEVSMGGVTLALNEIHTAVDEALGYQIYLDNKVKHMILVLN